MKEGFIKFILITLITFFSVSIVHAETDYSKPIWNTNVAIGYEIDRFSPTKVDSVENKTTKEIKKDTKFKKYSSGEVIKMIAIAIVLTFLYFGYVGITIGATLLLIGLLIVMNVKIWHHFQKKS